MHMDGTIRAAVELRKSIALSVDWTIEADMHDADGEYQAAFVKDVLDNLETVPFLDFLDNVMDYEWLGYMIAEPRWSVTEGKWIYRDLKIKLPEDFKFITDKFGNLSEVEFGESGQRLDPRALIAQR
jgi:phage gp29-like protein